MIQCIILHSYSIIVVPPYKKNAVNTWPMKCPVKCPMKSSDFIHEKCALGVPFLPLSTIETKISYCGLKIPHQIFHYCLIYICQYPMIFIHYRKGSSTLSCISNSNGSGHHLRHENHQLEAPSRSLLAGSPTVFFLLSKHHEIPMG